MPLPVGGLFVSALVFIPSIVSLDVPEVEEPTRRGYRFLLPITNQEYPLPSLRPLLEAFLPRPCDGVHHGGRVPRADDTYRPHALSRLVLLSLYTEPRHGTLESLPLGDRERVHIHARLEDFRELHFLAEKFRRVFKL